ncbi:hypothetical protein H7F33_08080 [Pedobacter sp. PAMC26386]|nr:hypothetical protein H7F33_08080 [Pedobacter sp. PAMC26386]
MISIACFILSCKKETIKQPLNNRKEVSIEYRITLDKDVITQGDIIYTDEAGVVTVADKRTLPFYRKFKRMVHKPAVLLLGIIAKYSGRVIIEIIVDGEVVSRGKSGNLLNNREMLKYTIH